MFRTLILLPNIFLPYSYSMPSWRPGFKPLKALTSYAASLGYIYGWYRYPYRTERPAPASVTQAAPPGGRPS